MSEGRPGTALPMLRWSSARDCARKAAYEFESAPHRDRTLKEDRQLARGRSVGRDYIVAIARENRWTIGVASGPAHWVPDQFRANPATADIVAEVPIRWPLGIGHADGWVRHTDTIVEVLSSQHASPAMIHSKLVQARGYAEWLPATSICVRIVDPVTLEDEQAVVTDTSPLWGELGDEVQARVAAVESWRATGTPPARVCQKPQDAHGHFCLYAAHCFAGWEEPPVESVIDDPDTFQLAATLYHAKQKEREVKQTLTVIEAERKAIEQRLDEAVPAGKHQVGEYRLVKSPRERSNFKLSLARQDSRIPADLLDEFSTVSNYTVFTIDRDGAAAEVDYGEEAPF